MCHEGDRIEVRANTTGPNPSREFPRVHASCGGVDFFCQQATRCSATSGPALFGDEGICYAETVYVDGGCAAIVGDAVLKEAVRASTPPVVVPGTPAVSVPGLQHVCAPTFVVCIGPSSPIPVVPAYPPTTLYRAVSVGVSWDVAGPWVEREVVFNELLVAGPIPVVACHRPCAVPVGIWWAPSAVVTVDADGTTHRVEVALP